MKNIFEKLNDEQFDGIPIVASEMLNLYCQKTIRSIGCDYCTFRPLTNDEECECAISIMNICIRKRGW